MPAKKFDRMRDEFLDAGGLRGPEGITRDHVRSCYREIDRLRALLAPQPPAAQPEQGHAKLREAVEWFVGDAKRQAERLTKESLQKKGLEAQDCLFLAALYGKHGDALAALQSSPVEPQAAQPEGEAVAVARAQGMHVGLCQQGMNRWHAMKRVRETFEKWYPAEHVIIKELTDDRFF